MKKKKYIVLIGLMVVFSALLVLSGCDQILEAMYYSGDNTPKGNNEVWIEVDIDPGLADWNAEVYGKIETANLGPGEPDYYIQTLHVPIDYQYDEQGNPIPKAYLDFWGLPGSQERPREYKVVVWIDTNPNEFPDWDEPQAPAVWNNFDENNPENTWADDIFPFPNDHDWSTIGGNAFLGAKAMNLNFDISGGVYAVPNNFSNYGTTYWLEAQDPDRQISHVYYEIDSFQDGAYYGGRDTFIDPPASGYNIDVTFDNLPEGDYWLTFNADYADGSFASRRYLIRAGAEQAQNTLYTLTIDINQLNTGPAYIPANTDKTFFVEIYDGTKSNLIVDQSNSVLVDDTGMVTISGLDTDLWNTLSSLTYHSSTSPNGQDWVRVVIDMNDSRVIDEGDMEAWMPISFMTADTTGESVIGIDTWDFYPILP